MLKRMHGAHPGLRARPIASPKFGASIASRRPVLCSSAAFEGSLPSEGSGEKPTQPVEQDYQPFPRRNESDPYKLLGIDSEASFEEIRDAKNYLFEHYKWHEPSREAIELAIDKILEEKIKLRNKIGYQPPGGKRIRRVDDDDEEDSMSGLKSMMDPDVTLRTVINEGSIYLLLAGWALFSVDQSFPLAGTALYCTFMYKNKRVKRNPEGPFLFNNPLGHSILSTLMNFSIATLIVKVLNAPLMTAFSETIRQVSAFIMISVVGILGLYLK